MSKLSFRVLVTPLLVAWYALLMAMIIWGGADHTTQIVLGVLSTLGAIAYTVYCWRI